MAITTRISSYLRPSIGGIETIEISGSTVGECLVSLVKQFPGIRQMLFSDHSTLNMYTRILVNGKEIDQNILDQPVGNGDELYVDIRSG